MKLSDLQAGFEKYLNSLCHLRIVRIVSYTALGRRARALRPRCRFELLSELALCLLLVLIFLYGNANTFTSII